MLKRAGKLQEAITSTKQRTSKVIKIERIHTGIGVTRNKEKRSDDEDLRRG